MSEAVERAILAAMLDLRCRAAVWLLAVERVGSAQLAAVLRFHRFAHRQFRWRMGALARTCSPASRAIFNAMPGIRFLGQELPLV